MISVGIDPGSSGAVAFIYDDGTVDLNDMPISSLQKKSGTGTKWQTDGYKLSGLLKRNERMAVFVEKVQSMPTDGHTGAFSFGQSYGTILGVLGALRITPDFVLPQVWKKHWGLIKTTKEGSRLKALEMWPAARPGLKRKKDHGRAEALLIAEYGRRKLWTL